MNPSDNKKALRREFLLRRKELSREFVSKASPLICGALSSLQALRDADSVCAFYSTDREPKIIPLLERLLAQGKRIFLPKYSPDTARYEMAPLANFANGLRKGSFGIPEPVGGERLANCRNKSLVWLVPGAAFSPDGARIGLGQGNYDMLLKNASGTKIGVCYACQMTVLIMSEPHDAPMDYVVTEEKIYKCNKNKSHLQNPRVAAR